MIDDFVRIQILIDFIRAARKSVDNYQIDSKTLEWKVLNMFLFSW